MKPTRLAATSFALLVLSLTPGFAGPLPNFSGTWQIDRTRSVVQSERPFANLAAQSDLTLVINHREPELTIEEHIKFRIAERTVVSTYYTDGRETPNRTLRGDLITSRSHWDQGALVTDLRVAQGRGGQTQIVERREVMRLSEDGAYLFMETTRRAPGQDKPEVAHLVFVKK